MTQSTSVPAIAQQASETRGLRVVFIIPGEARGNSMIFALRQAESLGRIGVDVHLFHLRSRTSPTMLIREWKRFRAMVRRIQPDVVHAHFGTVTGFFGWLAAGATPLVLTYRGSDLNPTPGTLLTRTRACIGRLLSQLAALGADRIVCVSHQLKRQLWWRQSRALILPSGVDPDHFYPRTPGEARAELGWPSQERVVLFNAGHDPRIKRLDLAYAAMAEARKSTPRLRMELMDGNTPPERVPLLMNACDCLLLTSDAEGSPTVIQEALACNLPVVSVDVGDTSVRLEGVKNSVIVDRDSPAIARALVRIVEVGERSDGRRKIGEFSLQRISNELLELYAQTARSRASRRSLSEKESVKWSISSYLV